MVDTLKDALSLWTTVPPYSTLTSATIAWRLLPAIANNKIRLFYRDGECVGLALWAFMTDKEFMTRKYSGEEIFARGSGDRLVVIDMIAPGGRDDVFWICRELRKLFYDLYPSAAKIYAHRGSIGRVGVFPNGGKWHEDVS